MAANDYYNDPYLTPSRQHNVQTEPKPLPLIGYDRYSPSPALNPYSPHSPVSTIASTDRLAPKHDSRFYTSANGRPGVDSLYSEDIPLKPQARVSTSAREWRGDHDQYPPSPESQVGHSPGLVPHPTSMDRKKKNGFFSGKIPWVVFTLSLIQISVFIAEIIKNSIVTGSPIMIHPQFNPMIGPSTYIQINMGSRFVPCMRTTPNVQGVTPAVLWPCPNTTTSNSTAPSNHCTLSDLCGFSDFNYDSPNQWFRFITPMFLHAGIIHIGFNMLLQLTMGREMELAIGSVRFALVYFSSGIFGFVLGGNFAASGISSTGASGCLFGILALTLLDLIYCWNERPSPMRDLMWILADVLISFVLGLLPGLDNFSHIGGFLMGLGAGICILHSPNVLRQRIGDPTPYHTMRTDMDPTKSTDETTTATSTTADVAAFAKEPVGFFKGRKGLWWVWWLIRAGALIGVLVGFVVLLNNFYHNHAHCSWCKYLSCLPINNWCNLGNLNFNTTTSNKMRRGMLATGSDIGPIAVNKLFELVEYE